MLYRTCKLGPGTLIGSSTQIQENTQIYSSVIGQRCVIGLGTVISNSYIFDNTHIGSNCVIERSIIGSNVHIKDNSNVPRGCLIADSVVIGPSAKLEPFDRLSAHRDSVDDEDKEHDSDLEEVETSCVFQQSIVNIFLHNSGQSSIDTSRLGVDSNALMWPHGPLDEDEDEDEASPENERNLRFMRIGEARKL